MVLKLRKKEKKEEEEEEDEKEVRERERNREREKQLYYDFFPASQRLARAQQTKARTGLPVDLI